MSDKTKGIVGSILIHVTLGVLLVLFGVSTPLPLPGEQGILINFGDDINGAGSIEPRPAPKQTTQPVQSQQEQAEQTPLTQDFEDAPSIPEPEKETPKPEEKKTEDKPAEEVKPVEEKPREVNKKALFPGQKTDGNTSGEGETGTEGNQGSNEGSVDSQSRVGGTVGGGDGISFSLGNRSALKLPTPEYPSQKSGTVVVEVRVDRNGNVTSVRGGMRGSTTNDSELIKAAERAARLAKFDVDPNATATQTGTITYVFKLQ